MARESLKEENIENEILKSKSPQTINLHDAIELVRQSIYSKSVSVISAIESVNPFNEFNPITLQDFQKELSKYNISVDSSYIEGIVSQMNLELGRQLINKTKTNILRDVISLSDNTINLLSNEELIQKYGINIDSKYMSEITEYVNNGINVENQKRNISIQSQQITTNSNNPISDNNVSDKEDVNDLFVKYPGYNRLYECFIELANTDVQKDALEQIMKYGEYNGFKLNSMLSNEKDSERSERNRRIDFAEMVLFDENMFFNLTNNGLNCFHGTKIEALETILSKGLFSSTELSEKEIQLRTGEEYAMSNSSIYGGVEKRSFISLTDDYSNSAKYAGFSFEEQTEFNIKNFGKSLENKEDVPIIICFNGSDIEQKYGNYLVHVKSTCNEIGVTTSIDPSDIRCIITSYDKVEEVKSISSKYGIDVLGYDFNNKFEKRLIDKKGKFYSRLNSDIVVDETEFASCKEMIKDELKKSRGNDSTKINSSSSNASYEEMMEELNNHSNSNESLNASSINDVSDREKLSDDLSMKIASEVKMDIAFNLIEQYNSGVPVAPITADNLIVKYNINERVAERLTSEINALVESYIQEKEQQKKNYTPYVLDGFGDETLENSHKHR